MIKNISTLALAALLMVGCGHSQTYANGQYQDQQVQTQDDTGHLMGAAAVGAVGGYLLGHRNSGRPQGYYGHPGYYGYPTQHVVVHHVYHHYYHSRR